MSTAEQRPLRSDAERNRRRILEAAEQAFAERGIAVTLDEVARRAGVGVGTVYRRFADKEQLVDALFEDVLGRVIEHACAGLAADDPWEGFVGFLQGAMALHAGNRALREVVFSAGHGHERVARARQQIAPLVEQLVRRAQAAGRLRGDVVAADVALVQFMVAGLMEYVGDVRADAWERHLGILLDGLAARREAPTPLPGPPLADDDVDRVMAHGC